jgi:hypothetical protein
MLIFVDGSVNSTRKRNLLSNLMVKMLSLFRVRKVKIWLILLQKVIGLLFLQTRNICPIMVFVDLVRMDRRPKSRF